MGQNIKHNRFGSTGSYEGYNYDQNIYIGRFNHKQCTIVKYTHIQVKKENAPIEANG